MNRSATALKAREQIKGFLRELSPRFSKPQARFAGDMLYGMQAAQDVKPSEIARALDAPISMKKQEDRLMTTLAAADSRKALWQVVEGCLTRWRVEDALRFVKQSYNLEDIRVLKYCRLKNMAALLLAAVYFNCVWLAGQLRCEILTANITHAAKRIYGIAEFMYYAVADGLGRLFARHGRWRREPPPDGRDSNPLGLVFETG